MKDKDLLKEVGKLGFILLEAEEPVDINKVLHDVVVSGEVRLLEGFPVMLINAAETGNFEYEKLLNSFKGKNDRSIFLNFLGLSLALYKYNSLKFGWMKDLLEVIPKKEKAKIESFLSALEEDKIFRVLDYQLSSGRIKRIFSNYFQKEEAKTMELVGKQEELSLEFALAQNFSPKQRDLLKKKLRGEKMSKTEKEYFSRVVKKKIIALSNSELHKVARKALEL